MAGISDASEPDLRILRRSGIRGDRWRKDANGEDAEGARIRAVTCNLSRAYRDTCHATGIPSILTVKRI